MPTRHEKDTMGTVELPADAYYGAQTQRAIANFPISGLKPHPALVRATLRIKKCAHYKSYKSMHGSFKGGV